MSIALAPGLIHHPGFLDRETQGALLAQVRDAVRAAPLFTPRMPRTGKPFSVRMTNCGSLGWISDESGYRYQPRHPQTGAPWPPIPEIALDAWRSLSGYPQAPQACLVNFYAPDARMGMHQDRDEQDFNAPVISLSLGDTCVFRYGGATRGDRTRSIRLESGDAVVIGGASRLVHHGVDRIIPASSTLLPNGGRINLTLRRVSPPAD